MAKADVEIRVGVDDKASKKLKGIGGQMERMSGSFRKAGIAMAAVGVAIAGVLVKMTMDYAKAGDEIAKMSKRIGVSTETLSKWKYMADLSGTSLSAMEKGMKKLSMSISDAKDGLMTYTREFEKININVRELEGLSPEDQFMRIAMAVAAIEDPMARASAAQKLFGRAGMELLPMLEGGAEGMKELAERASEFAVIFDEEAARAAEEFNDAITDLKGSLGKMGAAIAKEVMPDIKKFVEQVTGTIQKISEWIELNPQLVTGLKVVVGVLVGSGGLLIAFSLISRAIIAINAALIIMHSLSGPAGWALLAAGAGIAAAGIISVKNIMDDIMTAPVGPPAAGFHKDVQRFATGGIVTGPTMALIGEAGPEAVVPLGRGMGNTVHIHIGSYMGDESSLRAFSRKVKEIIGQDNRRTSFSGINRAEYFPGSSSV